MSETITDRATCPDCGKDVAVNKDGSLRRHPCVAGEVLTDTTTTEVVDPDGTVVRELATKPEAVPAVAKDPRLCWVPRCDRAAVLGKLCGAHWATRPDLRKVA